MTKPRLIYYQDAHHFHAKRLDPPVSMHMLQWPVDELLGTGADVLAFGLGYGDVYFHETKVGRVVGQYQEVWNGYIDWRIMRMVRDARALGTDQVRAVVERGHEMGLRVFPSLKLQSCDPPDSDRSGLLKWHHWKEVCLGEKNEFHPRLEYCYDYANPRVRDAKLAVLRELMEDYGVDGVELDFMFVPRFFKAGEEEKSAPIMSGFVAEIRGVADEVGQKQDRHIDVAARIFHRREHNLKLGLDPETWLKEKSIDIVVGQVTDQFLDTGVDARWLADAANSAGAAAYLRPPRRVYDERTTSPSIEMHRALSQTLSEQGFAGSYLANLPWPFAEKEHQILREAAYPGPNARQDKRYLLQPPRVWADLRGAAGLHRPMEGAAPACRGRSHRAPGPAASSRPRGGQDGKGAHHRLRRPGKRQEGRRDEVAGPDHPVLILLRRGRYRGPLQRTRPAPRRC